jgi:hypothetical protein
MNYVGLFLLSDMIALVVGVARAKKLMYQYGIAIDLKVGERLG